MSSDNKDVVVSNEYGIPDTDYAKERKAMRAFVQKGTDLPDESAKTDETVVEKKDQQEAVDETAETVDSKSDDVTQDTSKETKKDEVEEEDDPLADLPEDWKEKVASQLKAAKAESEKYKKKYDSDIGRINAYQSKYEESRRALIEKEQELAALKKTPPKALKDLDSPRIKQALETGEEGFVELMEEARAQTRKEMEAELSAFKAQVAAQLNPLYEQRQHSVVDDFNRKLNERWDNWHQVVYEVDEKGNLLLDDQKQPKFNEGWQEYVLDQPPAVRAAIEAPQTAADAIWAIENYNDWLRRNGHIKDDTAAGNSVTIPNADAIQKKREADLRRKAPPAGHQPGLQASPTLDLTDEATEKKLRLLARKAVKANDPSIYDLKNL